MAFEQRGRPGGKPDDLAEIEQMLRQFKSRVPRLGGLVVVLGVAAALWLATGFYTIAPDELGAVLRFGKMVRVEPPGPHLRFPWPVEQVIKTPVTSVQRVEVGFRTVRVGPPSEYEEVPQEAHMVTGDENIVSLEFIVQYMVKQASPGEYELENYLFNVKPTRTDDGKNATVKEVAEASMREVVGRHKIDEVLTEGRDEVQKEALALMQQVLDGYKAGIVVTAVQLQDVQPPTNEVRNAFKDVASAREDRDRSMQEARGYSNDLLPKAEGEAEAIRAASEGYAQARIAEATGQANRFLSMLAEYQQAKTITRERLYLETMEEILSIAEKIIVDSQAADQLVPYLPLRSEGLRVGQRTQQQP